MNDEQILEQQTAEDGSRISLTDILYVLRAHLLLIIIITVLFAAGGVAYSKVRKPVYTASVPVQFDVIVKALDEHGEETDKDNETASTNYLFRYIESAVGICKSGEVIDRANVYYKYYLDYYRDSGKKIDDFVKELTDAYKTVKASHGEIPGYDVTDELMDQYRGEYFNADKVGARYSSSTTEQRVDFSLWVKDLDNARAKNMARIYALAADVALNKMLVFDEKTAPATAGLIDLAGSVSGVSVSSDMSTMKIVIIAAVLGVVLALMTVYILRISDNSLKSKEQLEKISGANVIAYIEDVPEVG